MQTDAGCRDFLKSTPAFAEQAFAIQVSRFSSCPSVAFRSKTSGQPFTKTGTLSSACAQFARCEVLDL